MMHALIKQVVSTKYLGLTFDSNLTWKSHINELCSKLSKTVDILSKERQFVDNHILVMLYYSLIYRFLTYGVHVWSLTFPSFLTQLFIIQIKAVTAGQRAYPLFIRSMRTGPRIGGHEATVK